MPVQDTTKKVDPHIGICGRPTLGNTAMYRPLCR
jgi:hypothetical protein